MPKLYFPEEVPKVGDLLRVTPVNVDRVVRNYKMFCQEAYVTNRFYALDDADEEYIEVWLGAEWVPLIRFNPKSSTWSTHFDDQTMQLEVEKLME